MAYKIERRIIPGLTQGPLVSSNFVVAHDSGNPNNTGPNSLENEISFMTRNYKNAFTSHWVGGGGKIVLLAEVGKFQGGAGYKANPYGYAHVELARTNNAETFKKDYAAYVWLLRKLADDGGIPKTFDKGSRINDKGIKSHEWITKNIGGTTHVDPFGYLASFGITRAQFKKDIESGINESKGDNKVSTFKPDTSRGIGYLIVKVDDLNIRTDASFSSKVDKIADKDDRYTVYDKKNGLYKVGGNQWVSAGEAFVTYYPHPSVKIKTGGLSFENLIETLTFLKKQDWDGNITINWQKGNPSITTEGMQPPERRIFEDYLNDPDRKWWYKVIE